MGKAPKFFFGALFSLTRKKSTVKLLKKGLETFPVSFPADVFNVGFTTIG